jgi:toxin-antitoxin system PIN domain toxin
LGGGTVIVPDANVLIYAYDETSPYHNKARSWWEALLSGTEPIGIPMVVVLAFTRILTHTAICRNPLTVDEVRVRVEPWFSLPHVRLLSVSESSLGVFFDLLSASGRGGNLSTDALIALVAREHSAVIHSNDTDFNRFPGIKWVNPL